MTTAIRISALAAAVLLAGGLSGQAHAGNITPYYLFDGDSQKAVEIVNGAVTSSFSIPSLGYGVAITSSIWLGNRDNNGATQFTLGGAATGQTSSGPGGISQILDGTSNGVNNFGVTCCGVNEVTIANLDWTNQTALFAIPAGGDGIAYDTNSQSLFVSMFGNTVEQFTTTGTELGSFSTSGEVVGLAYEQATDTLWGWDRTDSSLVQYSTAGTLLQSDSVSTGLSNPFGGEMAMSAVAAVPEPASIALMGAGIIALGMTGRRKAN